MSQKLQCFLDGPLSDGQGGSTSVRDAAREYSRRDRSNEDQEAPESVHEKRSFFLTATAPLFSYQQEIVDKLYEWFVSRGSSAGALVSLPTGGGKTRTALWFCRELASRALARKVLWVAPSVELVEQAVSCINDLWNRFPGAPDARVVVNDIPGPVNTRDPLTAVFCTAQLAVKRLPAIEALGPDVLVFDEAHQAVARTFRTIVQQVARSGTAVVGMSATPGRRLEDEGEDLRGLFGNTLITSKELGRNPFESLVTRGVLSKLQINTLRLPPQWESIRVRSLQGRTLSVDELALNPYRFWSVVEAVRELGNDARALVFGGSLAHCYALAGAMISSGVRVGLVSYSTPSAKRHSLLTRFAAGELSVLLNKQLLATGYDCPGITDVVLATPVRSSILWEQILGRASRGPAVGGTRVGRVWELDDHRSMHQKVLSYARFLGNLWA